MANASPGEESGGSSASAHTRGPDRSVSDADTSADSESQAPTKDPASQDNADSEDGESKTTSAEDLDAPDVTDEDAPDVTDEDEDAIVVDVEPDGPELVTAETTESSDGDSEPDVPAPPVEAMGLAVRSLQDRREVAELAPTAQHPSEPAGGSVFAPLAAAPVNIAAVTAAEPPNWFAVAVNNAWNATKTVTIAVVNTVRRVVDGVVRTTVAVANGLTRFLWGDYIPKQNPTNTPGHWQRLQTVTGGFLNDGFHIDKIRSAYDGVERLVVYIGGTTLGLNQAGVLNGPSWLGEPKPWQIYQLGLATQSNPDMEILMFGYSQGGMDAQNLVARTNFNIEMVVTFGSPIVQEPPDPYEVWMLHLQAKKDPVIDWGRPGMLEKARIAESVYQTTTRTGNKPWADWNGLGEVHGDPATYREVAQKLDSEYLSDSNMDYWEGQYLRSY